MGEETYNFTQARTRLEEIVTQVRKKDTSLEQSLDLLEEGVRLANACTELIDHTEWRAAAAEQDAVEAGADDASAQDGRTESEGDTDAADDGAEDAVLTEVVLVEEEVVVVVESVEDGDDFGEADGAWAEDDAASDEG